MLYVANSVLNLVECIFADFFSDGLAVMSVDLGSQFIKIAIVKVSSFIWICLFYNNYDKVEPWPVILKSQGKEKIVRYTGASK